MPKERYKSLYYWDSGARSDIWYKTHQRLGRHLLAKWCVCHGKYDPELTATTLRFLNDGEPFEEPYYWGTNAPLCQHSQEGRQLLGCWLSRHNEPVLARMTLSFLKDYSLQDSLVKLRRIRQ